MSSRDPVNGCYGARWLKVIAIGGWQYVGAFTTTVERLYSLP